MLEFVLSENIQEPPLSTPLTYVHFLACFEMMPVLEVYCVISVSLSFPMSTNLTTSILVHIDRCWSIHFYFQTVAIFYLFVSFCLEGTGQVIWRQTQQWRKNWSITTGSRCMGCYLWWPLVNKGSNGSMQTFWSRICNASR